VTVLRLLALVLLLATIAAAAWFLADYRRFADAPLDVGAAGTTFELPRGAHFKDVVRQLRRSGLTHAAPFYWRLLGEQSRLTGRLHAGEYAVASGTTPRELLRRMAAGDVVQHRFTIVDGWTFRQLRLALAGEAGLAQTLTAESDTAIARRLHIANDAPEGWFLPETYAWTRGESDFDVLARAHAAMRRLLDAEWQARAAELPFSDPYQALILASIVEKETARGDERPQIAGVFVRRLRLGMPLQTDPTVIYGIGERYDGNIRRRDLETDTPYNTYTRNGLPPTPIALPGRPALQAVLHPAPGDALYFVARGDGSHEFSATLAAHNVAVARYQLRRRQ
jgi:UPF0755 protein